jgi:DNA-binding transcriptional LysR family regulator
VNLVEEGFDVAVRIGHLTDSSLVAKRLAAVRMVTCAAPDYLAAHGTPKVLEDLAGTRPILDTNAREPLIWSFGPHGDRREVRVHGRLRFNGARPAWPPRWPGSASPARRPSPRRMSCGPGG